LAWHYESGKIVSATHSSCLVHINYKNYFFIQIIFLIDTKKDLTCQSLFGLLTHLKMRIKEETKLHRNFFRLQSSRKRSNSIIQEIANIIRDFDKIEFVIGTPNINPNKTLVASLSNINLKLVHDLKYNDRYWKLLHIIWLLRNESMAIQVGDDTILDKMPNTALLSTQHLYTYLGYSSAKYFGGETFLKTADWLGKANWIFGDMFCNKLERINTYGREIVDASSGRSPYLMKRFFLLWPLAQNSL
jgi:hypothetical protein